MNVRERGQRSLQVGAELTGRGVDFRVWAPEHKRVEVQIEDPSGDIKVKIDLKKEKGGFFSEEVPGVFEGTLYRFLLDGRSEPLADPASRFQPEGPSGPSEVIDPAVFNWTDSGWPGVHLRGQVIYEMHIGTFTSEGTWEGALSHLEELADIGVSLLEIMPVADFAGDFGWGYDGVDLFAPTRLYGRPDDMRRFVDKCHSLGLGVVLDVVYNHLGPSGNVIKIFSPQFFTEAHDNEWGEAINFYGTNSNPVREFYLANVEYWIREYHLDGLRFDATDTMQDHSGRHILADISEKAREAAGNRSILLIAENQLQNTRLVRPANENGYGLDAVWNDDFHHSVRVAATGHSQAYYSDYKGRPQELISCVKRGYLYQGQLYFWQKNGRGTPTTGIKAEVFIDYIQNHDQVANSLTGQRIHFLTSPGRYRAVTALLLLSPGTPMLFQGQEFGASTPFHYFGNPGSGVDEKVFKGRIKFLQQFCNLHQVDLQGLVHKPSDPDTFRKSVLNHDEKRDSKNYDLCRDLLRLRRREAVFADQPAGGVDGAVLGERSFVLRFFGSVPADDRLLLINMGTDERFSPNPEPLLAPLPGMDWEILWTSEDPKYGGGGTLFIDTDRGWYLPGEAAVVMKPARRTKKPACPEHEHE